MLLREARADGAEAVKKLGLCRVVERGAVFKTGRPVTFAFRRNTAPTKHYGRVYGQDIEPAGRYMSLDYGGEVPKGWTAGTVTFKKPLVLKLVQGGPKAEIYGPTGWKARLKNHYGKKGKALSCALKKDGYDGIVTCDAVRGVKYTSEIVDLKPVKC